MLIASAAGPAWIRSIVARGKAQDARKEAHHQRVDSIASSHFLSVYRPRQMARAVVGWKSLALT
jgi:hypothetical protein